MKPEEKLTRWLQLTKQIEDLKAEEIALRREIFSLAFPNPKEGTNKLEIPQGLLKGTHTITRKIDEDLLSSNVKNFKKAGLPIKNLIKVKPELVTSAYRDLTEEQAKLFDACLIIKPSATPQLELIVKKVK